MAKCLVTKLSGSSNNDSLLKIGEIRMSSNLKSIGNSNDFIRIDGSAEKPVKVKMLDGYFRRTKDGEENDGIEKIISSPTELYPSIGLHKLSISPKYGITYIFNTIIDNIDELGYSPKITVINAKATDGDISVLSKLPELSTIDITGNLTGDIASVSNLTKLNRLVLSGNIYGDISSIKNLVNLTYFDVCNVSGNISEIKGLSKLDMCKVQKSKMTGDLAVVPSSLRFISFSANKGSVLNWSNRTSSAKVIAVGGSPKIVELDKMLQDEANCAVGFNSSDPEVYKTISVTGTRTSASDAAVQTLQSKGYTVSITPA